jgi:hypothetical protein
MNLNSFEVGDMIAIGRPGYKHVGIYIGLWRFNGPCVVHNSKRGGVILSTFSDFADNSQVFIHQKAVGDFLERQTIVQRALSLLGTKYDLLKFNCEHAATMAQSGVARSPQIAGYAVLALITLGLAIFAGKKA